LTTPPRQPIDPDRRPGLGFLALGGWAVAGLAVAVLAWTRFRPEPRLALAPVPVPAAAPVEPLPAPAPAPPPAVRPAPAEASLEEVVSRGIAAVVVVETSRGRGSAFFVAPDTLLTNVHVVTGQSYVTIRRTSGETATAYVGATAPEYDLAVLKLAGAPSPVSIPMGSAALLRPGQEVIAIGSPLGLQNSVTRGIVSGLRQMGPVTVVQTDAAINPGNSGGPLLDRNGNAIGINTFILSNGGQVGGQAGSQGLNFAVAIDHAKALLEGRPPAEGSLAEHAGSALVRPQAPSESDRQQQQGARRYEARLVQLAQAADSLDQAWERLLAKGFRDPAAGRFDHGWYAVWSGAAAPAAAGTGFAAALEQIRGHAELIKRLSLQADDEARQDGVLPGTRRELRQKYRLEYQGWGL